MRVQEFITKLAPMLGVDVAELVAVDRYLAIAGMRAKARGKAVPDITVREGLRLPLAVMASRTPAQAVTDLHDVERFKMIATGPRVVKGKPQALTQLIGLRLSELEELPLIDVLARMTPGLKLKVDNTLAGDDSQMAVELKFKSIEDFEPGRVVDQVEPLRKLMDTRNKLRDLMTKVDRSEDLENLLEQVLQNSEDLDKMAGDLGIESPGEGDEPKEDK